MLSDRGLRTGLEGVKGRFGDRRFTTMAVSRKPVTTTPASREAFMDIEAVAARLGVTVRHVRRLVAERRIPL